MCRDSAVGIATGYRLYDRGVEVWVPAGSMTGSGVHLTSYPRGTRGTFPRSKTAGEWSWGAEVKKTWIYTFTPPYALMAQRLISQAQGQLHFFTFYILCAQFQFSHVLIHKLLAPNWEPGATRHHDRSSELMKQIKTLSFVLRRLRPGGLLNMHIFVFDFTEIVMAELVHTHS
jgi:hypothetical protein